MGIREDVKTVFERDPAASSVPEVLFCYPGLHAIWAHRLEHFLWKHGLRFLARLLAHISKFFTGVEIHPGAKIGRRFFIDHGSGVVIGETAEIGDDVLLYQGVVLGGTSLKKGKRHPTLGNNVVMGAGSIALGNITVGEDSKIGSGSVVVKSVPPGATVVGIPGRVVEEQQKHIMDLEHGRLPDPVAEAIRLILNENRRLEKRLRRLERASGITIPEEEDKEEKKHIEKEFENGEET